MLVLGLTSGVSCGKTTIADFFKSFGVKVISADKIVSELYKSNNLIKKKLIKGFGKQVIKNNSVDRKLLSSVVFSSKSKLKKLNSIVHPSVFKEFKKQIKISKRKKFKIIVVEIPLLFEAKKSLPLVDKTVVVKTSKKNQLKWLRKRGFSKKDCLKRISSQISLSKKLKKADFIIDNSKSKAYTKQQVKNLVKELT